MVLPWTRAALFSLYRHNSKLSLIWPLLQAQTLQYLESSIGRGSWHTHYESENGQEETLAHFFRGSRVNDENHSHSHHTQWATLIPYWIPRPSWLLPLLNPYPTTIPSHYYSSHRSPPPLPPPISHSLLRCRIFSFPNHQVKHELSWGMVR